MYVKTQNGNVAEFPYSVSKLKQENPNTSFPSNLTDEILGSWGVYAVTVSERPTINLRLQKATLQSTPVLSGESWVVGWDISNKTSDEIALYDAMAEEEARNLRDVKLAETDFYALSDVTMSSEMATYRQALRDITTHANWPHLNDDDWPTKP